MYRIYNYKNRLINKSHHDLEIKILAKEDRTYLTINLKKIRNAVTNSSQRLPNPHPVIKLCANIATVKASEY